MVTHKLPCITQTELEQNVGERALALSRPPSPSPFLLLVLLAKLSAWEERGGWEIMVHQREGGRDRLPPYLLRLKTHCDMVACVSELHCMAHVLTRAHTNIYTPPPPPKGIPGRSKREIETYTGISSNGCLI